MASGPGTPELIQALTRVSQRVQAAAARCAAEQAIPAAQARLLEVLRSRAPTINELAVLLDLDKSSTSGLVDRAQRRGLVRRVPSQLDRRAVRVRLTDLGRALADELALRFARDMAAIVEAVPPGDHAGLAAGLNLLLRSGAHHPPPRWAAATAAAQPSRSRASSA